LGGGVVTDFLAINIATTDFVGHSFGPNSIEIQDIYLRLDIDVANFLKYLDAKVGAGNYLFFLSADHGVAHIPKFLNENSLPGGIYNLSALRMDLNQLLLKKLNIKNAIASIINHQVYYNTDNIADDKLNGAYETTIEYLKQKPFVTHAFETEKIASATLPEVVKQRLINGYNPKLSGDIQFIVKPGYFDKDSTGTTHGSGNAYDAQIPLIWFGWNVKPGQTNREIYMTDIAPTIAALLKIQKPNGCVGKVIQEIIK
jgi:predicted AlkP superfamily pyrophosphatase or phosphodiesterase